MYFMPKSDKVKFFILLMLIFFLGIVIYFRYMTLTGQFLWLDAADKEFISKIHAQLKDTGDAVLATKIHAGSWQQVCINPTSSNSGLNLAKDLKILNGVDTFADDYFGGIYFLYPAGSITEVEYFRIPWNEIYLYPGSDGYCVGKEDAFFKVTGGKKDRKLVNPASEVSPNFIELTLINLGKNK